MTSASTSVAHARTRYFVAAWPACVALPIQLLEEGLPQYLEFAPALDALFEMRLRGREFTQFLLHELTVPGVEARRSYQLL